MAIDIYTCNKCRRAARKRENCSNDVAKLLAFFRECKKQNPQFFCDFQLDNDGKIVSIFWSHASMQGEYADYGDAVTFDTTHKTNNNHMPLAMFVGCSNNLKNVSFGQALLRDETIDTFRWLFETFKSCMGDQQPFVILTGMLWLQKNNCHKITAVLLQLYL